MTLTRLLVSVRDAEEARIAVSAGADIIDVKEPNDGSLGFAGIDCIEGVLDAVDRSVPVSAALGECSEWADRHQDTRQIPQTLSFVKLGLAKTIHAEMLASHFDNEKLEKPRGKPDWQTVWQHTRESVESRSGWKKTESPPRWVAVAYADAGDEAAPQPTNVLHAAIEAGCVGLLIDTFGKHRGSTFEMMQIAELSKLRSAAENAGMFFALAGKIGADDMNKVRQIQPDILAVRGALCSANDRRSENNADKVSSLKELLNTSCSMR